MTVVKNNTSESDFTNGKSYKCYDVYGVNGMEHHIYDDHSVKHIFDERKFTKLFVRAKRDDSFVAQF